MNAVQQRLQTHRENAATDLALLGSCIQALFDCVQACTVCADACLAEDDVDLLRVCIRLDLDCADVCLATGRLLSRQHEPDWQLLRGALELAAKATDACANECNRHAQRHAHCRLCAQACATAQEACNRLLIELNS
jgi:hypothetical protein